MRITIPWTSQGVDRVLLWFHEMLCRLNARQQRMDCNLRSPPPVLRLSKKIVSWTLQCILLQNERILIDWKKIVITKIKREQDNRFHCDSNWWWELHFHLLDTLFCNILELNQDVLLVFMTSDLIRIPNSIWWSDNGAFLLIRSIKLY